MRRVGKQTVKAKRHVHDVQDALSQLRLKGIRRRHRYFKHQTVRTCAQVCVCMSRGLTSAYFLCLVKTSSYAPDKQEKKNERKLAHTGRLRFFFLRFWLPGHNKRDRADVDALFKFANAKETKCFSRCFRGRQANICEVSHVLVVGQNAYAPVTGTAGHFRAAQKSTRTHPRSFQNITDGHLPINAYISAQSAKANQSAVVKMGVAWKRQ